MSCTIGGTFLAEVLSIVSLALHVLYSSTYLAMLPCCHDSVGGPGQDKQSAVNYRHLKCVHHSLVTSIVAGLNIPPNEICPIVSQNKVDFRIAHYQSNGGTEEYLEIEE